VMLTFFIRESWIAEAAQVRPGWGAWHQLGVQASAVGIAITYAAGMTVIIVAVVSRAVGFRAAPEYEMAGMDHSFHGERGYGMLHEN
jgi:ammonium transporter, Amt family